MGKALAIVAAVLALDVWSKRLVMAAMHPGDTIAVIPGWLHLTYVRNPGAAYGLFTGASWLLVAVATVVVIGGLYYARHARGWLETIAVALLVSGAAGNLVDRLRWGLVTDFIQIVPLPIFQVFNVADTAITSAVVLILIASLRR